jgi:hypothetical protein
MILISLCKIQEKVGEKCFGLGNEDAKITTTVADHTEYAKRNATERKDDKNRTHLL